MVAGAAAAFTWALKRSWPHNEKLCPSNTPNALTGTEDDAAEVPVA